jgi:hypothetical protein
MINRRIRKLFIADKSWYNAIQSDLGGEWNLADLNACILRSPWKSPENTDKKPDAS